MQGVFSYWQTCPHEIKNLELFLPIRIVIRSQLGINLCYPCHALRKAKGVDYGLEMWVGIKN